MYGEQLNWLLYGYHYLYGYMAAITPGERNEPEKCWMQKNLFI